jgi:hypothetical protein
MWSLVFFFPLFALASAPADGSGWRALLHMEANHSNVESGSPFFLSGSDDPAAELAATERLFSSDPEGPCRYPARAIYLGLKPDGEGPICERWRKWREAVSAEGIELVFAAAFINSPSSMYGHTLLKFPRAGKTELLDYTLNYGADTGASSGLGYIWSGLTGGFRGYYATAPFYLKVKEYNFVENRDFWVYPLNVTPKELELLVAHAWELREVGFPYFFLRKNCAYYLLEFLEVARPGQGLVDSFPLWAVPMDTIRRLQEKGWLGEAYLRPSRHKVLEHRKASLLPGEAAIVSDLVKNPAAALPSGREAPLLDAAYDLWRYQTEAKKNTQSGVERELLKRRAGAGEPSAPMIKERPPHEGHPTNRIGLGSGRDRVAAFGELSYRGTLHDLLANPLGYEPSSELSMGDLRIRWQEGEIFAERFDLLRLRSLSPTERWFPGKAWSFRLGFFRAKEMPCRAWRCSAGRADGGIGISWRLGPFQFFMLAELDLEAGGVFSPGYRFAAGPTGGVFFPLWRGARAFSEARYRWGLLGEKRQARNAFLGLNQDIGQRVELRLEGEVFRGEREAVIKLHYYF